MNNQNKLNNTSKKKVVNTPQIKESSEYNKLWEIICMHLTQRTAQILNTKQTELLSIKWKDGESNTDTEFSKLSCLCCIDAWNDIKKEYPDYMNLSLECIHPDINIVFLQDTKHVASGKIELKSTKGKGTIRGSTIRSVDVNQPVIFCKRNESKKTFEFRYCQYNDFIVKTNTDTYQDRSPRPLVNFNMMNDINTASKYVHKEKEDYIAHFAQCANSRIKNKCKSWQDILTKQIQDITIKEFIKETSKEDFIKLKSEE
jgi:hypothetical protein